MDALLIFSHRLAHFLIGFYFVLFGVWNCYHWHPTLLAMRNKKLPLPWLLLPTAIAWQTLAGLLIVCNRHVDIAALSLIPYTLLAICIFHPFWKLKGELRVLNFTIFITNSTVTVAALLLLLHHGCVLIELQR